MSQLTVIESVLLAVAMLSSLLCFGVSVVALQEFEREHGKRPPSVQYWAFHPEFRRSYPARAKVGRLSMLIGVASSVAYFLSSWAH